MKFLTYGLFETTRRGTALFWVSGPNMGHSFHFHSTFKSDAKLFEQNKIKVFQFRPYGHYYHHITHEVLIGNAHFIAPLEKRAKNY